MKRILLALALAAAVVLGLTLRWLVSADPADEPAVQRTSPEIQAARGDAGRPPDAPPTPPSDPAQPLAEEEAAVSTDSMWDAFPRAACTGRVVDEAGAPLEGVVVSASPDGWVLMAAGFPEESGLVPVWFEPSGPLSAGRVSIDELPSARTDSAGRFEVDIPFATEHPSGFRGQEGRKYAELFAHGDGNVPARRVCQGFGPGGCDVGDIVLAPAATISGRTVDEKGEPIGGVDLEIRIDSGLLVTGDSSQLWSLDPARHFNYAKSGEDGRFRLSWLRPGTARLSFDVACRLPASREGIVLSAGDVVDLGDVVLERGGTISGRVLDEDGRPFPSAEVRISVREFEWDGVAHPIHSELRFVRWGTPTHGGSLYGEREGRYGVTRSGDDGSFVLGGLTRVEYGVYADAKGWEPDCVLHVATGSDGVRLELRKQGRLVVRLVDDLQGTPVSDATLTVLRGSGSWFRDEESLRATATSDGPGRFLLDRVCPAPMAVISESKSHGRQVAKIEGLALGAPLEEREVRVPLGAAVSGRVVDQDGAPLEGATIRLSPYSSDQALGLLEGELFASSAADGRFEFTGLTPAHWSLWAQLAGYRCAPAPHFMVAAGEARADVDLVMTRTGRVEGVVRGADGVAAQSVMVAAKEDERGSSSEDVARTDADGHYAMEVRPGSYALVVSLDNSRDEVRRTIQVAANEIVRADVTLPAPAVVSGRVLAAGAPCAGATVTLHAPNVHRDGKSNEHGEYSFTLSSGCEGDLWARSPRGGLSPTRPVVVKAGESVVLDLEFGSLSCSGTVVDSLTGAGIAGAKVSFSRRRGPNHPNPAVTDADGRFVVGDVAPGQWSLIAQHERYLTGTWVKVELAEGVEASPLRLELTLGSAVAGVVRTANGALSVQDLRVSAWRDGESGAAGRSDVDAGSYELIGLEPGRYTLLVTRESEWGLVREATEARSKARATVDLTAGQTLSLDLSLPPGQR